MGVGGGKDTNVPEFFSDVRIPFGFPLSRNVYSTFHLIGSPLQDRPTFAIDPFDDKPFPVFNSAKGQTLQAFVLERQTNILTESWGIFIVGCI